MLSAKNNIMNKKERQQLIKHRTDLKRQKADDLIQKHSRFINVSYVINERIYSASSL